MVEVLKRKGLKEPFNEEKVRRSIKKAFVDAGISIGNTRPLIEKITKDVIKLTKENSEVTSNSIRDKIFASLENSKKGASEAWKRFEQRYKRD